MDTGRQFTANARWAMLAKIISAGASAPFLLLLPRFLGSVDFGQFSLAVSALIILRIAAGGGLGYATGRRLAEAAAEGDNGARMMTAGLSLQLLLALPTAVVFLALSGTLGAVFGAGQNADRTLALLFGIVALTVVFLALVEFAKAAFQGLQRFHFLTLVTGIEFGGKLLFALGLAFAGYGVVFAFSGYAFALALAAVASLVLIRRGGLGRPVALRSDWRELFLYNIPLMLTTAGFIVYTEVDTVMVGYFSGLGQTGVYAAAKSIIRAAPLFAVPFGQAAAPLIVKLIKERPQKAADFVDRLLRYVAAVFFPGAVAIAVTAPYLVKIWGSTYSSAVLPLRIMSLFLISASIGVVITPIIDYLGAAGRRAKWMMLSVAVNIGLNLIFIPRFGAAGAAVSTVVTHGPFVLNNLNFLAVRIGLSRRRLVVDLGRIAAAAATAGAGAILIMSWKDSFVLSLATGAAVYLAGVFALGVFSRSELTEVAALIRGGKRPAADELVSDPVD